MYRYRFSFLLKILYDTSTIILYDNYTTDLFLALIYYVDDVFSVIQNIDVFDRSLLRGKKKDGSSGSFPHKRLGLYYPCFS